MAKVAPHYSTHEADKPPEKRGYHNNDACPRGPIPKHERREGTGGHGLCNDCARPDMAAGMSDKSREETPMLERRR